MSHTFFPFLLSLDFIMLTGTVPLEVTGATFTLSTGPLEGGRYAVAVRAVGTINSLKIVLVPPNQRTLANCKSVADVTATSVTEVIIPDGWELVVLFTTSTPATTAVTYTTL